MNRDEKTRRPEVKSCLPRNDQRTFSSDKWDAAIYWLCVMFGYKRLRPEQEAALKALFTGGHVLALLPTGYGKTVSFTGLVVVYDFLFNGDPRDKANRIRITSPRFFRPIIWVISPLTQLILNHVKEFNAAVKRHAPWLQAICSYDAFGGAVAPNHPAAQAIYHGQGNVIFSSPGHVTGKNGGRYGQLLELKNATFSQRIVGVVIDEVHCVQEWGHDFRTEYLLLHTMLARTGTGVPCGCFTATLTPEDQIKTLSLLHLRDVQTIMAPPNRPNIFLRVESFDCNPSDEQWHIFDALITELKERKYDLPKILIYTKRKDDATRFIEYIMEQCDYFEGDEWEHGLPVDTVCNDRGHEIKRITDDFMLSGSRVRILLASEVLGMGVDIKALSRVWVVGQPKTLKAYTQYIGRCGRSGQPSESVLFVSENRQTYPTDDVMRIFCRGESCLRLQLAKYFMPTISIDAITASQSGLRCCSFCALQWEEPEKMDTD